jgi:hypothetical protein
MAIGDAQRYEIIMDNFPLFKMYHYDAGTSNDKTIWSDAGKTTPLAQPAVADANGMLTFFADGEYRMVFKDSADVSIDGMDYDKFQITADMATTFEANQGTILPGAAAANKGHLFALFDVSNNILGLYQSNGTAYKPLVQFNAAGAQIFSSVITNGIPVYDIQHADYGATPGVATDQTGFIDLAITDIETAGDGILYARGGVYQVDGSLDPTNCSIEFRGDGVGVTIFKQTVDPSNPMINYSTTDIKDRFATKGISFVTTVAGSSEAVKCAWPVSAAQTDYQNCNMRDTFVGPNKAESATAYFSDGIILENAKKAYLNNIMVRGKDGSVTNGEGITIKGKTEFSIFDAVRIHYLNKGVNIQGTSQLFSMSNSEIITCNDAVDFDITGGANYTFDNVNFGSIHNKVIMTTSGTPASLIVSGGCKFSKASTSSNDWRAIDGNYTDALIEGNDFIDNGSSSGTDIVFNLGASCADMYITKNNIKDFDNAGSKSWSITAGAVRVVIDSNREWNVDSIGSNAGVGNQISNTHKIGTEEAITGATPVIRNNSGGTGIFAITQGGATNVTNFTFPYVDQQITVRAGDGNSTIKHGAAIKTVDGLDFAMASGDRIILKSTSAVWYEIGRSKA